MRKCISVIVVILLLCGCSNDSVYVNKVISLRDKINSSTGYNFNATVTLDYGDTFYTFGAECRVGTDKNMKLTILEPASIAGISGQISGESGKLTFDEQVLAFELIADGLITPICTPWLLMEALGGGYISTCGSDAYGLFAHIDDSFNGAEFSVDIWFNEEGCPSAAEMVWEGKRIVSMTISDFVFV